MLGDGGEDDAVDPPRGERAALRRLDLGVAVGVGDQHGVAVAPRAPHDGLRERRRKGVHGVRDDEPERARGLLLERARDLVRPVAELEMAASTRERVSAATGVAPRTTFETVDFETPAWRATSLSVTATRAPRAGRPPRPRSRPRA